MGSPLGALRKMWFVAVLGVVLAGAQQALYIAMSWDACFGPVFRNALTGADLHVREMIGPEYVDAVYSTRPSLSLLAAVAVIACAAGVAARAAHVAVLTRWIGPGIDRSGPPYRTLQPVDDTARQSRAAMRAFAIRLSLVMVAALSLTLFGAVRVPADELARPGRTGSPKPAVAAQVVAVVVENLAFTPIALALLVTARPTRQRIARTSARRCRSRLGAPRSCQPS